jgi:hypothetical protein
MALKPSCHSKKSNIEKIEQQVEKEFQEYLLLNLENFISLVYKQIHPK